MLVGASPKRHARRRLDSADAVGHRAAHCQRAPVDGVDHALAGVQRRPSEHLPVPADLEDAGHHATVYLPLGRPRDRCGLPAAADPPNRRTRRWWPRSRVWEDHGVDPATDLVVAGWETAYPAYRDPSAAPRAYFVQDFEPSVPHQGERAPARREHLQLRVTGITAGDWLATNYAPTTDGDAFLPDTDYYQRECRARPAAPRRLLLRPAGDEARRGQLGVMTMQHVKRIRPNATIHLARWDVSDYDLPGSTGIDHGAMQVSELNDLYNRAAPPSCCH